MTERARGIWAALWPEYGIAWRWLLVLFWVGGIASVAWLLHRRGYGLADLQGILMSGPLEVGVGPAIGLFLVAACVRPFLLIPTTAIVVGAGFAFGPWVGLALAVTGLNLGASCTWVVGRWVTAGGAGLPSSLAPLRLDGDGPWSGFGAVCTARLANLPCDAVSFSAGSLGARFPGFLFGTALGSLPGVTVLALAGGALSGPDNMRLVLTGGAAALLVALLAWLRTRRLR